MKFVKGHLAKHAYLDLIFLQPAFWVSLRTSWRSQVDALLL